MWRPPLHLSVVAIEKGDLGSALTMVAKFPITLINTIYRQKSKNRLNVPARHGIY